MNSLYGIRNFDLRVPELSRLPLFDLIGIGIGTFSTCLIPAAICACVRCMALESRGTENRILKLDGQAL